VAHPRLRLTPPFKYQIAPVVRHYYEQNATRPTRSPENGGEPEEVAGVAGGAEEEAAALRDWRLTALVWRSRMPTTGEGGRSPAVGTAPETRNGVGGARSGGGRWVDGRRRASLARAASMVA
jgi:hypothetical protein